jgi:DNA-binding SARP family transcriptional activator
MWTTCAAPVFRGPAIPRAALCLFGHGDQVFARHLAHELGVIGAHVLLDDRRNLLDGLAVGEKPALTPNDLGHDNSLDYAAQPTTATLPNPAILLAAKLPNKHTTRIQLCGRLAVQLAGRELTGSLPGGQARILLTFLVMNRARSVRREELIDALWPWRRPGGADASLSALLSRLRAVLGEEVLPGRAELRVRLPQDAWVDFEAAQEAIHRAESAVTQGDWARGWGPALVALFTARRGFLTGEDLPWAAEYRARLEEIHCAALECYAAVSLGVGGTELAPGERAAHELVATEPFREHAHALLMEILVARGNGAEALRVYESLRRRLREELGAAPSPELRALQERLLRR